MMGTSQPASSRRFLISGNGCGGFRHVHGDADKFRAGLREFEALLRGGGDVGSVRVGHGLHDHGRAAADLNLADLHSDCFVPLPSHCDSIVANWATAMLVARSGCRYASEDLHIRRSIEIELLECLGDFAR